MFIESGPRSGVSGTAVADIAAAAFCLDEHVVPGRLAQSVDRIVRHENRKETLSLIVKTCCGIYPLPADR
jgi:predicted N-acetyltransferase YhbS